LFLWRSFIYQRLRDKKLLLKNAEKIGFVDAFVYVALGGGVQRMLVMNRKSDNTHITTITEHVTATIYACKILPV